MTGVLARIWKEVAIAWRNEENHENLGESVGGRHKTTHTINTLHRMNPTITTTII
jgi:hypothetical protein